MSEQVTICYGFKVIQPTRVVIWQPDRLPTDPRPIESAQDEICEPLREIAEELIQEAAESLGDWMLDGPLGSEAHQ